MELKMNKNNIISKEYGFTLIELLIAMAITGIISAAIFTAFQSQQKSYLIQEDVAAMQQNLRAGMDMMVREIRMAGYDPMQSGKFGFVSLPNPPDDPNDYGRYIGPDGIAFYTDYGKGTQRDNGIVDNSSYEQIAFRLNVAQDGSALAGNNRDFVLRKYATGAIHWQPLAENIEALGFAYAYDEDSDGNLDTSPNGHIIWAVDTDNDGDWDRLDNNDDGIIDETDAPAPPDNETIVGFNTGTTIDLKDIRAVRIWMLAKAGRRKNKYSNNITYVVGRQVITPNNKLRMRFLTTTVKCRNMGL